MNDIQGKSSERIAAILLSAGVSGYFFDDQAAIKQGALHDGAVYHGEPVTPGFSRVRVGGESVSIMTRTASGSVVAGDCAAVQYSGAGGRDPLFLADRYIPVIERYVIPLLEGVEITSFRDLCARVDAVRTERDERLHTAILYGVSQFLLNLVAAATRRLPVEVLCDEYDLPLIPAPIPLFGQSGDDRYIGVDKMILKQVDVLPHALINSVPEKLGYQGELLKEYLTWLRRRIGEIGSEEYHPILHIDVYGTAAMIFNGDTDATADYLAELGEIAAPYRLYIEGPIDAGGTEPQIEALGRITRRLGIVGSPVRTVADEWCNTYEDIKRFTDAAACHMVQIKTPDLGGLHHTVESVLYCRQHGMEAYQGGTCNETDVSARACVHAALASRPHRMLVKPGMGFDEGLTIVRNEMQRTIALMEGRA